MLRFLQISVIIFEHNFVQFCVCANFLFKDLMICRNPVRWTPSDYGVVITNYIVEVCDDDRHALILFLANL